MSVPPETRPPRPMRPRDRVGELRAAREPLRLVVRTPSLLRRRAEHPSRVIVVPAYGNDDRTTAPLRRFLRRVGHEVRGWGHGVNGGDLYESVPALLRTVRDLAGADREPVALVGWSLGGVVAREAARERPHLVSRVVTFGSPLQGPRYTTAAADYDPDELDRLERLIEEREDRPITRPITAVYSRRDGIVDWTTCIDRRTPGVVNVEVGSTHVGMGIDPDVWTIVADALDALSHGSTDAEH